MAEPIRYELFILSAINRIDHRALTDNNIHDGETKQYKLAILDDELLTTDEQ